jgi:hypothetical protein
MRGSLRIRHARSCPAFASGRARDAKACRCAPSVQGRVGSIARNLGQLPAGWRAADLLEFERALADLRLFVRC